jgi:uncharacterized protein YlxW (UPF0749 family)
MSDSHPPSHLVIWLRANVIATIGLSMSIMASCGWGVWTISKWINAFENQISLNQSDVLRATRDVLALQNNIVSLDGRVNELRTRVIELHAQSDTADAQLKARLDMIDALAKFNTERSFQTPLPTGPRR